MNATAIIAAGGSGQRFKSATPKQFLLIQQIPMIVHTLRAFESAETIDRIVVVLPSEELHRLKPTELKKYSIQKVHVAVPGGKTRQESVLCGLEAIDWNPHFVAIHDAARCLVTPDLINRTVRSCEGWDGAIAALPIRDTIKRVKDDKIEKTESRESLWGMQTPQVFRFPLIRDAYRKAKDQKLQATDDAAIVEKFGGNVRVVEGSTQNFKITFEEDLQLAEKLLRDS